MTHPPVPPKTRRSIWFEDDLWDRVGNEAQQRRMTRPSLVHEYVEAGLARAARSRTRRRR